MWPVIRAVVFDIGGALEITPPTGHAQRWEVTEYFAALRPRYRTGILSDSFVGTREREHQRYGFEDLADVLVYSHEIGV